MFFVLVYLASILLSYNTDQAFIKANFRPKKILGLFMNTTVPCPFTVLLPLLMSVLMRNGFVLPFLSTGLGLMHLVLDTYTKIDDKRRAAPLLALRTRQSVRYGACNSEMFETGKLSKGTSLWYF
jgi:hypothetical protein